MSSYEDQNTYSFFLKFNYFYTFFVSNLAKTDHKHLSMYMYIKNISKNKYLKVTVLHTWIWFLTVNRFRHSNHTLSHLRTRIHIPCYSLKSFPLFSWLLFHHCALSVWLVCLTRISNMVLSKNPSGNRVCEGLERSAKMLMHQWEVAMDFHLLHPTTMVYLRTMRLWRSQRCLLLNPRDSPPGTSRQQTRRNAIAAMLFPSF